MMTQTKNQTAKVRRYYLCGIAGLAIAVMMPSLCAAQGVPTCKDALMAAQTANDNAIQMDNELDGNAAWEYNRQTRDTIDNEVSEYCQEAPPAVNKYVTVAYNQIDDYLTAYNDTTPLDPSTAAGALKYEAIINDNLSKAIAALQ